MDGMEIEKPLACTSIIADYPFVEEIYNMFFCLFVCSTQPLLSEFLT